MSTMTNEQLTNLIKTLLAAGCDANEILKMCESIKVVG